MSRPSLVVSGLEVRYGSVAAVRGVSFEVAPGEILGLIGPNGAGKSSTLHAIMGLVRPAGGDVRLGERSVRGRAPEAVARGGIALVPEGRRIFAELTVDENLRLGLSARRSMDSAADDVERALELFPVVREFRARHAGALSGGQQLQLAIARALVSAPDVLLLDEPSLGLSPTVTDAVFGALAGARSLNEMAVDAWGADGPEILHICGERDFEALRDRVDRPGYVLMPHTDHFGDALAAADLAVSRAGGTVWELAAAGTPAILVPYPHATADHQTLNARHFERGGGAVVVPDAEVDRIPALVGELLADPARLATMRDSMLTLARPDAADVVADELLELARAAK